MSGERRSGRRAPSLEAAMHAAVYRARPDVRAVVHSHSAYATARSFNSAPLMVATEERCYLGLDCIEVAERSPAGSDELAGATVTALGSSRAVLLACHGVLAVGDTVWEALEMCSTVEQIAKVEYLLAAQRDASRGPRTGGPLVSRRTPPVHVRGEAHGDRALGAAKLPER